MPARAHDQRYHLLLQASEQPPDFYTRFADRGIRLENTRAPNAGAEYSWFGFHEWQIETPEVQDWLQAQPPDSRLLWLMLEPNQVWAMSAAEHEPAELHQPEQLADSLAPLLATKPEALSPQLTGLSGNLRQLLPGLLSAAGLPGILAEPEPDENPETRYLIPDPLANVRRLAGALRPVALNPPLMLAADIAPEQLFVLAWLMSDQVAPVLRVCEGFEKIQWPEVARSQWHLSADHADISLDFDATPFGTWSALRDAWAYLRPQLDKQTQLELWIAPLAYEVKDDAESYTCAIQRYTARLSPEHWQLEAFAPAVPQPQLEQALALCHWVIKGTDFQLADATQITLWHQLAAKDDARPGQDYLIDAQGRVSAPEKNQRAFLARRWFLQHFADTWDLKKSQALEAEVDDANNDLLGIGDLLALKLAMPRSQELLLEGRSGHFWRADSQGLDELQGQQLFDNSAWWQELGFETRADVIWEPAPDVMMRLMSHQQHPCCLTLLLTKMRLEVECLTWFDDGAQGHSSSVDDLPDFSTDRVWRFDWGRGALSERLQSHLRQCQKYTEQTGAHYLPLPSNLNELLGRIDQNMLLVKKKLGQNLSP